MSVTGPATHVVVYLRLRFSASDPGTALLACRPLVEELGVRRVAVAPPTFGAEDDYVARLKFVEPIRADEDPSGALRRVALPLWLRAGYPRHSFALTPCGREVDGATLAWDVLPVDLVPDCAEVRFDAWVIDGAEDDYDVFEPADMRPPEQRRDLLNSLALTFTTKAALVADVVGVDEVAARDFARAAAVEFLARQVPAGEPVRQPDGSVRVRVGLGVSDTAAEETFRRMFGSADRTGWAEPSEPDPDLHRAVWAPDRRPETGIARLELQVGREVDLGVGAEDG